MNELRGRRRLLVVTLGALIGTAAASAAQAATKTVRETGNQFVDAQVNITVGDRVRWQFNDSQTVRHSVTFDDGSFDGPDGCLASVPINCQGPGDVVERDFDTPGRFFYHCKIHGAPQKGMFGVVIVEAVTVSSSSPASTTSSTLARATTTSSTAKSSTSSTTATTRALATSSTLASSSTTSTTADTTSVLLPGDAPAFAGDDTDSAAGQSGGSDDGSDSKTVALIVVLLLVVSGAGGFLLWRLRPGRV